jgi:hypothetical protein
LEKPSFDNTVFINCPFDEAYAPLLESAIFTCVYLGFHPLLASISSETGEYRLEKIIGMIKQAKYSIHDLSRSKALKKGDEFRMNMPFEFGIDFGLRHSGRGRLKDKKFLVFEAAKFDLKRALSDTAGQDVEHHGDNYVSVVTSIRNFFCIEARISAAGPQRIVDQYATFLGWLTEKKIAEGHSEQEALNLPTRERIDEMWVWRDMGKPASFMVT